MLKSIRRGFLLHRVLFSFLTLTGMLSCNEFEALAGRTLQISNIQPSAITASSATILWQTNLGSNSWTYYGLTSQYGQSATNNSGYIKNHKVILSQLLPNTTYHFKVQSMTSSGQTQSSADWTFTTQTAASPSPSPSPTPSTTSSPTRLGTTAADWDIVYRGYGSVSFDATQGIILQPAVPESSDISHASLMLSHAYSQSPIKDFEISVVVMTEQQLRSPNPNPWEVFWLFFNYTSDSTTTDGHKKTNYFLLRTNGVELGKAFDLMGQTYLVTDHTAFNQIGTLYNIRVRKVGQKLSVFLNGTQIVDYMGTSDPDTLYDFPGTIGLYTESARVHIYSVDVTPL